ncbi:MAG: alpha/beta hydrolase [Clostridia bacterium]|nr:alpha/beta hydrolase [Clostridia bacterium]
MKLIYIKLGDYASLTGYVHETHKEMPNLEKFPAMLVVPGGGFRFCSAREAEPIAMAYYAEGYSAFTLEYTTVTAKPDAVMQDPINDCTAAIRYIRDHAEELCIDANKLAMIGFSGGGHLAAAVSTHCEEKPNALLLGYPGIVHSDLRALDCPDIVECVDENTPPSFIFSTRNDNVTPPVHPLSFANALMNAGVDFELHIFRDGPHGLSLAKEITSSGMDGYVNPAFAEWFGMSVRWLKDTL